MGPTPHLSWNELSCVNRRSRRWNGFAPGEMIAEYPQEWRKGRAVELAETFEDIRRAAGNLPILITSAYRTSDYNRLVGGAKLSQHVSGRALDIYHPRLRAADLFTLIRHMYSAGELPFLGGIGRYPSFVHIDVRPRAGRLSVWYGSGEGS